MRKILLSLVIISSVAAAGVLGTRAFFSDTETSSGNTFVAGVMDLAVGNDSYYNGAINPGTSWSLTSDLGDDSGPAGGAYLFFNFIDVKPGDWGEDTIQLRVSDNNSYVCSDVTLNTSDENTLVEPETDLIDTAPVGELAGEINFIWWADDGDNVLEEGETILPGGPLGVLGIGGSANVTIADSQTSIFDPADLTSENGFVGDQNYYIGKAWCFGNFALSPVLANGGVDPTVDPGFSCDGSLVSNISQTDSMTATIAFSAVQERNNTSFVCAPPPTPAP